MGAGTGGILECRWCKHISQAKPAPTAVFLCSAMPAEAPARGNSMTRALCVQGACAGEADQFCKLFQQAFSGNCQGLLSCYCGQGTSLSNQFATGLH